MLKSQRRKEKNLRRAIEHRAKTALADKNLKLLTRKPKPLTEIRERLKKKADLS